MTAAEASSTARAGVSVVLPYYNEENFISATLHSLAAQTIAPARLILVDNASSDKSADLCRKFRDTQPGMSVSLISEDRPGKINALEAGFALVDTPFVAFCDADTFYPPHYLELSLSRFAKGGDKLVGVMGIGLGAAPGSPLGLFQRWKGRLVGTLLAKQCHTGGYGQIFRTAALRACGGYSRRIWPYMQADHEVVHRILKHGKCAYHHDLWCLPSTRRKNRDSVSWTLFEAIIYHLTPFALKDWYFYRFLRSRFIRRRMINSNLRHQPWRIETQPEN